LILLFASFMVPAPEQTAEQLYYESESCTSVIVGKKASTVDGSTITSHSCDSGTDRTWITLVPRKKHIRLDRGGGLPRT
jgi:dipeptidase